MYVETPRISSNYNPISIFPFILLFTTSLLLQVSRVLPRISLSPLLLISSSSLLPRPFDKSLPRSSFPQTIHHIWRSLHLPLLHTPSTHSFFHLIIIPSLRSLLLELARSIYPPVILRSFQSTPPPFSSRFPVRPLAKPLSTELLHPLCVILTPLPASFLPVYAPFLFISADACVSTDTSLSPSISPTSLHVSVHKDGTCLPWKRATREGVEEVRRGECLGIKLTVLTRRGCVYEPPKLVFALAMCHQSMWICEE